MNPVSAGINSAFGYSRFIMDDREFSASQMNKVETTQKQARDITLITAEGDKVTLSSDSWVEETTLTYDRLIYGKGASARTWGEYSRLEGTQDISISVEGDLSKEELQDIQKLMKDVDRVMRDFLAGDMERAMGSALKIGGLDSISSFEASLQFERSTSVVKEVSTRVSSASPTTDSAFALPDSASLQDLVEKTANQLAGTVRGSGIDSGRALGAIEEYFSKLFSRLSDDDSPDSPKLKAAGWLRSALLDKLGAPHEKPRHGEALEG